MIGVALIAEAFDQHIPKGYLYLAMAFSLRVELMNLRLRPTADKVKLHSPYAEEPEQQPS
jgi:predicted tellurium resistance membrane protein TerC